MLAFFLCDGQHGEEFVDYFFKVGGRCAVVGVFKAFGGDVAGFQGAVMSGDVFMEQFGASGADDFCADLELDEDGELFYGKGDFVTVV